MGDQGDLSRLLRRTIDLLRQIPVLPRGVVGEALKNRAREAADRMDRFPVSDDLPWGKIKKRKEQEEQEEQEKAGEGREEEAEKKKILMLCFVLKRKKKREKEEKEEKGSTKIRKKRKR